MDDDTRPRDAQGFLVDVLEAFPNGALGAVCLTVQSNRDRDRHFSQIMVVDRIGVDTPQPRHQADEWIYSLARLPDGRFVTAQAGGILRSGPPAALEVVADTRTELTKLCSSHSGVFLIGLSGYVGHFDGATVTRLPDPQEPTIHHVAQAGDGTVFACGPGGLLLRLGDGAWERLELQIGNSINRIVALARDELVLCGSQGLCARFQNNELLFFSTPDDRDYFCLAEFHGRWHFGAGFRGLERLENDAVVPFKEKVYSYELFADADCLIATGLNRIARHDGTGWVAADFI